VQELLEEPVREAHLLRYRFRVSKNAHLPGQDKIDGIFTERKCIVRRRRNGSLYRCEKTVLVSSMPC
jgi:hypothetical protein